ncbi:hypothetical protein [Kocuria sp. CPCC 205263]|uniref:hypothetical protein n=1 Tax=Kocuria sp. CPCC 205263 TaxID=3073555 RepID=UPI0034D4D964
MVVLPRQQRRDATVEVPSPARTLRLIVRCGPLCRTLGLLVTVAFSVAALPIFAATLAARSEYAPVESRGQVFIWVGALKIDAGPAAAGATITHAAWAPLVLVSSLTVVAATASVAARSRPR